MQSRIGKEVTVEDVTSGRTVSESQLKELGGELFECNKAHNDALVRVVMGRKYPRRVLVVNDVIMSVKIDDRGFVVHKWTRKIADLKQVYLVVKQNRSIYQLALEFCKLPSEKNAFTDVLQFDPATSRTFTQLISNVRKEILNASRQRVEKDVSVPTTPTGFGGNSGSAGSFGNSSGGSRRFTEKYGDDVSGIDVSATNAAAEDASTAAAEAAAAMAAAMARAQGKGSGVTSAPVPNTDTAPVALFSEAPAPPQADMFTVNAFTPPEADPFAGPVPAPAPTSGVFGSLPSPAQAPFASSMHADTFTAATPAPAPGESTFPVNPSAPIPTAVPFAAPPSAPAPTQVRATSSLTSTQVQDKEQVTATIAPASANTFTATPVSVADPFATALSIPKTDAGVDGLVDLLGDMQATLPTNVGYQPAPPATSANPFGVAPTAAPTANPFGTSLTTGGLEGAPVADTNNFNGFPLANSSNPFA